MSPHVCPLCEGAGTHEKYADADGNCRACQGAGIVWGAEQDERPARVEKTVIIERTIEREVHPPIPVPAPHPWPWPQPTVPLGPMWLWKPTLWCQTGTTTNSSMSHWPTTTTAIAADVPYNGGH